MTCSPPLIPELTYMEARHKALQIGSAQEEHAESDQEDQIYHQPVQYIVEHTVSFVATRGVRATREVKEPG